MKEIFAQLKDTSGVKGMIIHSLKPDNFVAGADVRMLEACTTASEAEALAKQGQDLFQQLSDLPYPVVAAIHGPCLGGGLELALACDYRVCTDSDKTRLGLPEVQLGLLPGSGGTQRLPRLIGLLPSLDLILTGKQLRAKKAKKLGVVDACVPETVLLDVAKKHVEKGKKKGKQKQSTKEKLMSGSGLGRKFVFEQAAKKTNEKTRGNYPATVAILEVIQHGLEKGFAQGQELEAKRFGELVMSSESKALRSIFFATTEMKKENGAEAEPTAVNKVGVLGGGLMGAGISHVSVAKAKVPVRIKDVSNDGVLNALNYNYKLFESSVSAALSRKRVCNLKCCNFRVVLILQASIILMWLSKLCLKILTLNRRWLQILKRTRNQRLSLRLTRLRYQFTKLQKKQSVQKTSSVCITSAQ